MADETSSLFPSGNRIGSANLPLGAQLYDNAGTPKLAADLGARELFDSGNAKVLEWDAATLGYIKFMSGAVQMYDTGEVEAVSFSGDGSALSNVTVTQITGGPSSSVFGWAISSGSGWSPTGNDKISSADGLTYFDNSGFVGIITDGTLLSINNSTRQLIANDGSTVALDWSEPDFVSLFGSVIINANGDINGHCIGISDENGRVFDIVTDGLQPTTNLAYKSADGATYLDNSGFHGVGSVIAGTKTATGTATTTFVVTIGVTMANTTYKVTTEGDNALSAAVRYVTNKTTTTFDVVYLAGLTGAVSFDWMVSP